MIECEKCGFRFYIPEMRRIPISQPHPSPKMRDANLDALLGLTHTFTVHYHCPHPDCKARMHGWREK